ncbi:hypothetical protein J1N35_006361 [Gossypium stocksii]|uniref:Reverse transcriptase zinc-binding domain-containing protein n=1 Tax=Gossypium stocksii TaxID=47602 RepID=A0A9D4AK83_9ROSI|nr:hypothetical protein J1N35_006361 [Gossypium stocksii]
MQTMLVPKSICDEIKRVVQKFIWGSHNGSSKTALVSWDSVCQPKSRGGLGLRQLKDHNISFIMKVLHAKYRVPNGLPKDLSMSKCSFLWRSISKGMALGS